MTYADFKQAVLAAAQAEGLTEYDLYCTSGSATTVQAFQGDIDAFSDTTSLGACFRCVVDGRMGYSNTQLFSAQEAVRLVRDAKAGAAALDATGFTHLYKGGGDYTVLPQAEDTPCDVQKLKEGALSLEVMAKAIDPRVESSPFSAILYYGYGETHLANSFGLDLTNRQAGYAASYEAVVAEGGRKYVGNAFRDALTLEALDLKGMVADAVGLAVGSIGGTSVPSGTWPVIFSATAMAEFFACFTGAFSADAAQKGLSLLVGKEGEAIAAPMVTVVDDPHYLDSSDKAAFDGEGVPTYTKTVIENGVLKTLLYDLKSAAKAGRESTGNGRRAGYAGDVDVHPFTFYIQAGEGTQADLMRKAGKAIFITEMKGMHAGVSPVTGDFSVESKGYLIENGAVVRPAEQFTVAGNFFQMIKDITALGGDFTLLDGVGAPSALVSGLSVAGV